MDKAFEWAEQYNLKILVDLHTVPGSQNGMDNGGICGLCTWHLQEENITLTLDILVALAKRYCDSKALFGIEPVNEPIDEKTFKGIMHTMDKRYNSNIEKSQAVPTEFLKAFYKTVYDVLTPILKDSQKIVFHDGFRLHEWNHFMPRKDYPNVWFDTHMYLNFAKYELKQKESSDYITYIYEKFSPALQEAEKYHPVIVGEWTIAHSPKDCELMTKESCNHYYRGSASLQEMVFSHAHGWMYFNYRVLDTSRMLWDFTNVVEKKLLIL